MGNCFVPKAEEGKSLSKNLSWNELPENPVLKPSDIKENNVENKEKEGTWPNQV
jgi:hypothetical protein